MIWKVLLTTLLLFGCTTWSQIKAGTNGITVDPQRTVKILGGIDGSVMTETRKLEKMSSANTSPVYIIINSPGGAVEPGMQFLNAMILAKSRGVELICIVPNQAASMAFHFLAECDQRYAFKYSLLLWHPMRFGSMSGFTADEMEYLVKVMRSWEVPLNNTLINCLNITRDLFYYHYAHETLFTTTQLQEIAPNFITVISKVEGVKDIFAMSKPKPFLFGDMPAFPVEGKKDKTVILQELRKKK